MAFDSRSERSSYHPARLALRWAKQCRSTAPLALAGLLLTPAQASAGQECPRGVEVEFPHQTPTPEDTPGQIHRHGRARNELYDLHRWPLGPQAQDRHCRDQRSGAGEIPENDPSPATPVHRGGSPERLASRGSVSPRRRARGRGHYREPRGQERCQRCSRFGTGLTARRGRNGRVQSPESIRSAAVASHELRPVQEARETHPGPNSNERLTSSSSASLIVIRSARSWRRAPALAPFAPPCRFLWW